MLVGKLQWGLLHYGMISVINVVHACIQYLCNICICCLLPYSILYKSYNFHCIILVKIIRYIFFYVWIINNYLNEKTIKFPVLVCKHYNLSNGNIVHCKMAYTNLCINMNTFYSTNQIQYQLGQLYFVPPRKFPLIVGQRRRVLYWNIFSFNLSYLKTNS